MRVISNTQEGLEILCVIDVIRDITAAMVRGITVAVG
jgi:hypothetical protein